MALFTTTDRDNVKAALLAAAVAGTASVSVGGQSVQSFTLKELRELLQFIQEDLASANSHGGMRLRQLVPGDTG